MPLVQTGSLGTAYFTPESLIECMNCNETNISEVKAAANDDDSFSYAYSDQLELKLERHLDDTMAEM
jgi:hypothetical protein